MVQLWDGHMVINSTSRHLAGMLLAIVGLAASPLASAACAVGSSFGGETSLQAIFDDMFGAPTAPSVVADCVMDPGDALWSTVDSVGSATILVEVAGNANGNAFGIYDSSDAANSLQIFSGPASTASRAFITVSGGAGAYVVTIDRFENGAYAGTVSSSFGSSVFGFYLQQPSAAGGQRFYSESYRNPGRNGDASLTDYLYSYRGNDAQFLFGSAFAPDIVEGSAFAPNDAILAWEDLSGGSDGDFQDLVVLVRDIIPVPLPAAVWLLLSGFGLVGLAARRRRATAGPDLGMAVPA